MLDAIDPLTLPIPAQKALAAEAPAPLKQMAARGALPGLKPPEIVQVLVALASGGDEALAEVANATLSKLAPPVLSGALGADLPALAIDKLGRAYAGDHAVLEQLLRMPRLARETLEYLADAADERGGELIATNEQRMLANPTVIEKLYMNKRVRMSTADRLIELAVRNGLELGIPAFREVSQAIKNELISEPTPEPTFDDILFNEVDQAAESTRLREDEDTHEIDEEGEERVRDRFLPLYAQIAQMTITQKIRRALVGTAADRLLLVRDSNRLVAVAAVKSPRMQESEAAQICASRSVSEEVLRTLGQSREFTRSYQVKLNLVSNPRTPFTFAARFMPHLRENDVKILARSKNVSGAVSQAASQQLARKVKSR